MTAYSTSMNLPAATVLVLILALFFVGVALRASEEPAYFVSIVQDTTSPIPKIIHQTAMSDESRWPAIWKRCQESWKRLHPDFRYVMWTDEAMDAFMRAEYPSFYAIYASYDLHIKRVDVVRYFILYHYGGIYADMDYECMHRFYEELPIGKACIAESPWKLEGYQNALMASPAGHPFWLVVFQLISREAQWCVESPADPGRAVLSCTGPNVIREAVAMCPPGAVHTLSRDKYAGEKRSEHLDRDGREGMYAIHWGTSSWTPYDITHHIKTVWGYIAILLILVAFLWYTARAAKRR